MAGPESVIHVNVSQLTELFPEVVDLLSRRSDLVACLVDPLALFFGVEA